MNNKNEANSDISKSLYKDYVYCNLINCADNPGSGYCMHGDENAGDNFLFEEKRVVQVNCKGILGECFCFIEKDDNQIYRRGDLVILGCDENNEIGTIEEIGNIVNFKFLKNGGEKEEVCPVILRKATKEDTNRYRKNLEIEEKATPVFKSNVERLSLNMKLVDIHYQFDRKKLFFFYTSDGRVDFRELARTLAQEFKTRIELRQIGVRDEAKRLGGLGSCGREYCCAAFLMNFKRITTQLANEQNLSANMSKLSGPCGKLKCCLSFEVEE